MSKATWNESASAKLSLQNYTYWSEMEITLVFRPLILSRVAGMTVEMLALSFVVYISLR